MPNEPSFLTLTTAPRVTRTFRMAVLPLFGAMGGTVALGLLPLFLWARYQGDTLGGDLLVAAVGFELLWAVFIAAICPIHVTDRGISAQTFWGKQRTMAWDEIGPVVPCRFFGLPYLRLHPARENGGAILWLPLALSGRAAFRETVATLAPAGNPLRRIAEQGRGRRRTPH